MFWFPGYPGPLRARGHGVSMPALPAHPGGPAAAASSPLAGLAAYGVPVVTSPNGQPVLRAGAPGAGIMMPPQVTGMPQIPTPPANMLAGGPEAGGLMWPMAPVASFDPGNLVAQMRANDAARGGSGTLDQGTVP